MVSKWWPRDPTDEACVQHCCLRVRNVCQSSLTYVKQQITGLVHICVLVSLGLKPVSCPVCKTEFSRKYHLIRHNYQTGCDGSKKPTFPCQVSWTIVKNLIKFKMLLWKWLTSCQITSLAFSSSPVGQFHFFVLQVLCKLFFFIF